ncbi:hypothetical protein M422DRAFT_776352 [Sphaerobolus stellatus SS14]|nr:hypothetical protein M422DRAFT_776352 [Sphaerobolus stellatus SS14]
MASAATILFFLFVFLGNAVMFLLLITLWVCKQLPQRNNPFLINVLITTYIATLPPMLLLFSGHFNHAPPMTLCLIQAILLNGLAPMFGTAMLILVINTWFDLRAKLQGDSSALIQIRWLRVLFLVLPYLSFLAWSSGALAIILVSPINLVVQLAWCVSLTPLSQQFLRYVGFYMPGLTIVELIIEAFIARMVIKYRQNAVPTGKKLIDCTLFTRLLVFSIIQAFNIGLGVILSIRRVQINDTFIVIEAMNALATFLVFGTSKSILEAWGLKASDPSMSHVFITGLESETTSEV